MEYEYGTCPLVGGKCIKSRCNFFDQDGFYKQQGPTEYCLIVGALTMRNRARDELAGCDEHARKQGAYRQTT
jgi:hypothetical protein